MATLTGYPFLDDLFSGLYIAFDRSVRLLKLFPGSNFVLQYIRRSYQHDPFRTILELLLLLWAIRYVLSPRQSSARYASQLTEGDIEFLCKEWAPEPLCEPLSDEEKKKLQYTPVLSSSPSPICKLEDGKELVNFATLDFLNLSHDKRLMDQAEKVIRNYGVGACGPPGFYGAQDLHLKLEKDISAFLGVSSTILYAQSFQTISSVIPAFAKRGDFLVVDRNVNYAILTGIELSRSHIYWYNHNDMDDLERVCQEVVLQRDKDKKNIKRSFIITEGLSALIGDIVDLPKLIDIKLKYKFRLILDETYSFGTYGKHGRGLTEYFNVPAEKVDMLVGSLCTSFASGGGFCSGNWHVVEHQRTTGLGYVFSASPPSYQPAIASQIISILKSNEGVEYFEKLRANVHLFNNALKSNMYIYISSHYDSPTIHLRFSEKALLLLKNASFEKQYDLLFDMTIEARSQNLLFIVAQRLPDLEQKPVSPSIRVSINRELTSDQVEKAASVIDQLFNKYVSESVQS